MAKDCMPHLTLCQPSDINVLAWDRRLANRAAERALDSSGRVR
ncbi:hypothetical protein Hoch_2196 [Haliangium ochraceum DSM 14365]|uniref:Uncharacterized protein n=1 Tax=Haliangium ochraceum (strain DSM 14365 / JCM 11303 / SMP-2) TaxID=502025 RepID=D0LH19_HALO1|nr:hypothetical protein Hoch_2196 [Haliangium ochraceum DSM 14365]